MGGRLGRREDPEMIAGGATARRRRAVPSRPIERTRLLVGSRMETAWAIKRAEIAGLNLTGSIGAALRAHDLPNPFVQIPFLWSRGPS